MTRVGVAAPRIAAPGADLLGESPVWSAREQALWWVDIRAPALRRLDPATGAVRSWAMPDLCCGVALLPDALVLGLRLDLVRFDPATGERRTLLRLPSPGEDGRLNEMRCDRQGRLWAGTMRDFGAGPTGALYRIGPDLAAARMLSGLTVPNALAWSADGRTMCFADTARETLSAHACDPGDGPLGPPRPLMGPGSAPGRPDGAAMDAEGFVWNARYGGGCVVRVTPDGRIDRVVALPATQPTACAFGGPDLRTLFVTTARQRLDAASLAAQPAAGSILALRTDTPGLPEPVFAPAGFGGTAGRATAPGRPC